MKNDIKIALVHDFLNQYGGAERTLEVITEMFPEAPIYTLLYDSKKMRGKFSDREIHTSFLQKFPKFLRKRYQWFLPLLPVAPETFDLREFDLVISSSGAWSKGIITRFNTIHIAYIHSPMRFVWDYNERYLKENRKKRMTFFVRPILSRLRVWDKVAADRPDYMIANSVYTQKRIGKYYRRESTVIYPPVRHGTWNMEHGTGKKQNSEKDAESYFLIVSRLSAYKKIEPVVEAFNKLGLPLVVVGEGREEKRLRELAGDNIRILGWQSDEKIEELYAGARAFLFPGVDDFGIAPAEALAFGVPALAIRKGGVKEIVEEGKTGEFFDAATPEVIADAVRRFLENEENYDKGYIIESAKRFGKERFKKEFMGYINSIIPNS